MFIEHRGGLWQLKPALAKGKDSGWADCAGGCALEACTSRIWNMDLGKAGAPAWTVTPSMKMVTGAEAERMVSGPCVCAPRESQIVRPPSLTVAACSRSNIAPARCRTRACIVRVICTWRCDPLPFLRLKLKRLLLPTATPKLPSSSSAVLKAPWLLASTGRTRQHKREGRMGAFYTARTAMPPCALSTVEACGNSNLCYTGRTHRCK
jgi:hypothetical protein